MSMLLHQIVGLLRTVVNQCSDSIAGTTVHITVVSAIVDYWQHFAVSSSLSSSGRLLYTRGPSCRIRSLQLSNEIDSGKRKGPYIEDRNLYFKGHIECLLSVSSHLEVTIYKLTSIHS